MMFGTITIVLIEGMSIIIDEGSKIIIQAMTENEGRFHTASMLSYETKVVAGVTPCKGGQETEIITEENLIK